MQSTNNNMFPLHKLRVLVVENDPEIRNDHVENLTRWKCIPVVAEGFGEVLLGDARSKAQKRRCHVALVDMRLFDDNDPYDTSGLTLIPTLKPTSSIIVSGHGDRSTAVKALREVGALDFVGKEEGPDRLKQALEEADRTCRLHKDSLSITWPQDITMDTVANTNTVVFDEILDEANEILGRLFPNARAIYIQHFGDTWRSPLDAPRRSSITLQAWVDDNQPVVIKLARAKRIETEEKNYQSYVKDKLNGHLYIHLQSLVTLWHLGGVVYEFVGKSQMKPFSKYYSTESVESINKNLTYLFDEIWIRNYRDTRKWQDKSLFVAYSDVWGNKWHERLHRFPNKKKFISFQFASSSPPLKLPNPVVWVMKHVGLFGGNDRSNLPDTYVAVTHGDLHGDNFFVDENNTPWVIDYERTGPGPILQDFVELELDILSRLVPFQSSDRSAFYELAVVVTQPKEIGILPATSANTSIDTKAVQVISELRRLAQKQTHISDMRQYFWGLLLNTVFRATTLEENEENDSIRDRALMLGGMICHRLDHASDPWPPAEWPPLRITTGESKPKPMVPKPKQIDIAIVTAMPEELAPVLDLLGGKEHWQTFPLDNFIHYHSTFAFESLSLTVVACSLWKYGGNPTTAEILRLKSLRPRLIIMTGICAGWEAKGIHLGDVIIAERAFHVGEGKKVVERFQPDTRTYQPPSWLISWLTDFSRNKQWFNEIQAPRPRSLRYQAEWVLCQMEKRSSTYPATPSDQRKIAMNHIDFPRVRELLSKKGLISGEGMLTLRGTELLNELRQENYGKSLPIPDRKHPSVHYGAFASTEAVIAGEDPFHEPEQRVRSVRAIELEVASLLSAAAEIGVPAFAVKGVSDYGTPDKDDAFHAYAAEASARWAFAFLREYAQQLFTNGGPLACRDQ